MNRLIRRMRFSGLFNKNTTQSGWPLFRWQKDAISCFLHTESDIYVISGFFGFAMASYGFLSSLPGKSDFTPKKFQKIVMRTVVCGVCGFAFLPFMTTFIILLPQISLVSASASYLFAIEEKKKIKDVKDTEEFDVED